MLAVVVLDGLTAHTRPRSPIPVRFVLPARTPSVLEVCRNNICGIPGGVRLEAPSISVWRSGQWIELLLHEVGCPGGMQHVMAVDMTDKLLPTDRKIRIASNMVIYWDRIFLGVPLSNDAVRLQTVGVRDANLHFRGYARAYSPDGCQPELYDYARIERSVPWDIMKGRFTRYGDLSELIRQTDDCYAIMSGSATKPLPNRRRKRDDSRRPQDWGLGSPCTSPFVRSSGDYRCTRNL